MKSLDKSLSRRAFAGSALAAGAFAATRGMGQTPAPVPTMDFRWGRSTRWAIPAKMIST